MCILVIAFVIFLRPTHGHTYVSFPKVYLGFLLTPPENRRVIKIETDG